VTRRTVERADDQATRRGFSPLRSGQSAATEGDPLVEERARLCFWVRVSREKLTVAVLGAAGLALGVAAFTILLAVTFAFQGEVTGSLLGNAIIAQARAADYLSVALSLLLGVAGAVDVLVLSQRERAGDLAVLRHRLDVP
jgi:hypothetical protein